MSTGRQTEREAGGLGQLASKTPCILGVRLAPFVAAACLGVLLTLVLRGSCLARDPSQDRDTGDYPVEYGFEYYPDISDLGFFTASEIARMREEEQLLAPLLVDRAQSWAIERDLADIRALSAATTSSAMKPIDMDDYISDAQSVGFVGVAPTIGRLVAKLESDALFREALNDPEFDTIVVGTKIEGVDRVTAVVSFIRRLIDFETISLGCDQDNRVWLRASGCARDADSIRFICTGGNREITECPVLGCDLGSVAPDSAGTFSMEVRLCDLVRGKYDIAALVKMRSAEKFQLSNRYTVRVR